MIGPMGSPIKQTPAITKQIILCVSSFYLTCLTQSFIGVLDGKDVSYKDIFTINTHPHLCLRLM